MPRRKHDFYETPPHYLEALADVIALPTVQPKALDVCVGDGAIRKWLEREYHASVIDNDIDLRRLTNMHHDAATPDLYHEILDAGIDLEEYWWITNPAFNKIDEIITQALAFVPNVVTLARLSFLEPTEARRVIYDMYQPDMVIVLPRYSFRENDKGKPATDSVTCAWIGWGPGVPQITTVWTKEPK